MIQSFLQRSKATDAFRQAVGDFLASGQSGARISFDYRSPAVKVERVVTKLLEAEPGLEIESVAVDGRSGCEYFRGEIAVSTAGGESRRFGFHWDCRWRAEEQGWTDHFGFPDQIRAAREFGYDCFRAWGRAEESEEAAA